MRESLAWSRYLEKVLTSPYGPRLPWWFPASREYWRTGDVELDPRAGPGPVIRRWAARLAAALPWRRPAATYQRVRCCLCCFR
jgi:hypothetical protein